MAGLAALAGDLLNLLLGAVGKVSGVGVVSHDEGREVNGTMALKDSRQRLEVE